MCASLALASDGLKKERCINETPPPKEPPIIGLTVFDLKKKVETVPLAPALGVVWLVRALISDEGSQGTVYLCLKLSPTNTPSSALPRTNY